MKNFFAKSAQTIIAGGIAALAVVAVVYAGNLTAPSGSPSAQSYTLGDIYNRLTTNATATTGNHSLSTTTSPASSFYTLAQIYAAIPTIDPTKVATGTPYLGVMGTASPYHALPLKTGQTLCYDSGGTPGASVPCTGVNAGEDGQYQKGVAHSYVDNSIASATDLTITDNATGLMWQKCAAGYSGTNCATGALIASADFPHALAACEATTTSGYTDWRLPNINELVSLTDLSQQSANSPPFNTIYFPNLSYDGGYDEVIQGSSLWSSSDEKSGASGNAFILTPKPMANGRGGYNVTTSYKGGAFYSYICVRSLP